MSRDELIKKQSISNEPKLEICQLIVLRRQGGRIVFPPCGGKYFQKIENKLKTNLTQQSQNW